MKKAKNKFSYLEQVAFHEAGHAVLSYHFGHGTKKVTIIPNPDKGSAGHHQSAPKKNFHPDYDLSHRMARICEEEAVISLAGVEAEKLLIGRYNHRGAEEDYGDAVEMLHYLGYKDEEILAYVRWLRVKTKGLLKSQKMQDRIRAIVKALLEKKILTGKELKEVIKQSDEENYTKLLAKVDLERRIKGQTIKY